VTKAYRILNTISGLDLGIYEADTAEQAIRALLDDAGVASDEPADDALVAEIVEE